jgi:hypothetical protein
MNPEGIGVQPMLANVSLQVSFIGGQGLSKPVERLQNALSSNFYANTEMYDERSISTVDTIGGKDREEFTKDFLEKLQVADAPAVDDGNKDEGKTTNFGVYIGALSENNLEYSGVVSDVFTKTESFFNTYKDAYNIINKEFGPLIIKMLFSPDYREINKYDIFNTTSLTPGSTIDLFGLPKGGTPHSQLVARLKLKLSEYTKTQDICTIIGFDKVLTQPQIIKANELLKPYLNKFIGKKLINYRQMFKLIMLKIQEINLLSHWIKLTFW